MLEELDAAFFRVDETLLDPNIEAPFPFKVTTKHLQNYIESHVRSQSVSYLLAHLLTYLLIPRSTILLQKLTGSQLVRN